MADTNQYNMYPRQPNWDRAQTGLQKPEGGAQAPQPLQPQQQPGGQYGGYTGGNMANDPRYFPQRPPQPPPNQGPPGSRQPPPNWGATGGPGSYAPQPGFQPFQPPSSGWGYPVMGQPQYGGGGTTQPGRPGRPPTAGAPGAMNYPTPGNTYPLYGGQGNRPGYMNPGASYGQPFPGQQGGGGYMTNMNQVQPQMAYDAMAQNRRY